ncbi:hypothetical protein AURDEDRAFT_128556 [Auricularia subglabra TFB-10046 SS5]|nr:hypothetical protein AURDEDRAFT_128556 [Auricularia subglabra TFB-10046 SS5]
MTVSASAGDGQASSALEHANASAFLGRFATCLGELHLENFANTTKLRSDYWNARHHRAQSWSALPSSHLSLRHLSLLGSDVVPDRQTSEPDPDIEAWEQHVTAAIVRAFPHAQIMETLEIHTTATTMPTLMLVLSHFGPDPLHFDASMGSGEDLRLAIRSLARQCTRTPSRHADVPAPLVDNIVQLTVHRTFAAWQFVSEIFERQRIFVGILPNVRRISVVLGYADGDMREEDDRYSMRSHAGHCCFHLGVTSFDLPLLECVELVGPDIDIALLMGKGLRRNIVLVLNNIQIQGDSGLIWGYLEGDRTGPCESSEVYRKVIDTTLGKLTCIHTAWDNAQSGLSGSCRSRIATVYSKGHSPADRTGGITSRCIIGSSPKQTWRRRNSRSEPGALVSAAYWVLLSQPVSTVNTASVARLFDPSLTGLPSATERHLAETVK